MTTLEIEPIDDFKLSDVIKLYEDNTTPLNTYFRGNKWLEDTPNSVHLDLLFKGALSVIHGTHYFTPKMVKAFEEAGSDYDNYETTGHLYVSLGHETFGKHIDNSETILVQIIGTSFVTMKGETTRLEPGDIIKLPYRVEHEIISAGPRVSLSIPYWAK